MKKVVVIGAGGHARVLISTLKALGRDIIGILQSDASLIGQSISGLPIFGTDDMIKDFSSDFNELVNGVGSVLSTGKRKDIYLKFKNLGFAFQNVIHPSATVMADVTLGEGVQIMAGAIIQPGCVIGDNSIINTGAIVDHDCIIGDHTHIAPGAVLSGGVCIGRLVHIGTSATIIQGVEIGEATTVGAGAVVVNNMPSGVKVVGVPARKINL